MNRKFPPKQSPSQLTNIDFCSWKNSDDFLCNLRHSVDVAVPVEHRRCDGELLPVGFGSDFGEKVLYRRLSTGLSTGVFAASCARGSRSDAGRAGWMRSGRNRSQLDCRSAPACGGRLESHSAPWTLGSTATTGDCRTRTPIRSSGEAKFKLTG